MPKFLYAHILGLEIVFIGHTNFRLTVEELIPAAQIVLSFDRTDGT